jgi:TonB family protein
MGLWEFLRQWQRGRLVAGVVASLLVHVLLAWSVLWGLKGQLLPTWVPKRGDTIIVELPRPEEPATAGSPKAPPASSPPSPPASRPSAPPPAVKATPPPTAPPSRAERRVAVAPRPPEPVAPSRPEPVPRAVEPAPPPVEPTPRPVEPAPRPVEPAPHAVEPAPRPAEPPRAVEPPARVAEPAPPTEPPAPAPATTEPAPHAPAPTAPRREGADTQVAALPPPAPAAPSASDVRAALRRGAGGHGQGRGGIEGDPIPLDSEDARFSDYLEQVRRRIKDKWGFPCVRKPGGECQGHTTSLDVQFGILKDGSLQFVDIIRSADYEIYDEYALNAIRLAQPFPPVPPALMAAMRQGSTGLAIRARFIYVAETSLTHFLR